MNSDAPPQVVALPRPHLAVADCGHKGRVRIDNFICAHEVERCPDCGLTFHWTNGGTCRTLDDLDRRRRMHR